MKNILFTMTFVCVAAFLAACGAPATNVPANNSNTNTKPTASGPTVESFLAMDKEANEAYIKGDAKHFETMLSDATVMNGGGHRLGKADIVKQVGGVKCDIKDGWTLADPQMVKINDDTYAVSYTSNMSGTCTYEGKSEKMDNTMRNATVWVRNGDKWQAAFHGENVILDPKTGKPMMSDETKSDDVKKADTETKKDEPKADDVKKSDALTADTKTETKDAKPAPAKDIKPVAKDDKVVAKDDKATTPEEAKPAMADANTEALVKLHTAGWEAFRNKDAKGFESILAPSFSFVDPAGMWHGSKADAVKTWTETMKCEGVTKTSVSDGVATAVSPTVEILTLKGTADGTCDGHKNGDIFQTAVYVKEGSDWKLAFMFEQAPMPAM